jgi:hypothetical protein
MRSCWIDADNVPNPAVLDSYGVQWVSWAANDPQTTAANIDNWRHKYRQRIYMARNWYNTDPASWARIADQEVKRCGGDSEQLGVDFNVEPFDAGYVRELLTAWRSIRPNRDTCLVIEYHKGALLTVLIPKISADQHLLIMAEAYVDPGPTAVAADEARSNLVSYGVPRNKALVMYLGEAIAGDWDGCAFTQGRLK